MLEDLSTRRINAIVEEVQQEPDTDADRRLFDSMIPTVEASDNEVLARFRSGRARAADIIQLDQKAAVHAPEPVRLTQTNIPKIKHGTSLTEQMLALMEDIRMNLANTRNKQIFDNWVINETRNLINGVRDTRELLFVAMMLDDLDYNRYGIIMRDVNWGTPASLKSTPLFPWTDTVNATPVSDIQTSQRIASDTYDEPRDVIVMTRKAEQYIYATQEFQRLKPAYLTQFLNATNLPNQDTNFNRMILRRMFASDQGDVDLYIYDKRTYVPQNDGSAAPVKFMPENKVILTSRSHMNDANTWDFANAIVIETMQGKVPSILESFDGAQSGPVAYATGADPQGNPPGEILWAVQRGFPRKHNEAANSVITIY